MKHKETIANIRSEDIEKPTGAYRIDMLDRHTGRVKDRIEVANYITPVYERFVRWSQGLTWHNSLRPIHNSVRNANYDTLNITASPLLNPPPLPVSCIVGSDSGIPEAALSSWGTGRTTGWGARWKANIPASGKRGQINEAQCVLTADTARTVWDFNENQGNGTYRSMLICQTNSDGNIVLPKSSGYITEFRAATIVGSNAGMQAETICYMDDDYVYTCQDTDVVDNGYTPATDYQAFRRYDLTDVTIDPVYADRFKFNGTAEDVLVGPAGVARTSGTNKGTGWWNYDTIASIAPISATKVLMAYADGTGSPNLGQWDISGGGGVGLNTQDWVVSVDDSEVLSEINSANTFLCQDGTYAYVVCNSALAGPVNKHIYRVRLSDQAITLFPLAGSAVTIGSITLHDGALFVVTDEGLHRYNKADGSYQDSYGQPNAIEWNEATLVPWGSTMHNQGFGGARDSGARYGMTTSTATERQTGTFAGFAGTTVAYSGVGVFSSNGKLWAAAYDGKLSTAMGIGSRSLYPLYGGSAFSRATLPAEVSKTAASSMKWTYEITLPEEWRAHPVHNAPPTLV